MIKVDGQYIVHAACNNGSTALITREGELLMFGKDTTHTDHTTGMFVIVNAIISFYISKFFFRFGLQFKRRSYSTNCLG